jgi:hypothetical protein
MTSQYKCGTCRNKEYHVMGLIRCTVNKELIQSFDKQYQIIEQLGCASHSDFNKLKKPHDVEEFYKKERVAKYKDTIFEETEDGGAIIGYLTESPSGCPRPNMAKLTKKQYTDYKKHNVNYGD